jgi:RNA-directed DNA polymerase
MVTRSEKSAEAVVAANRGRRAEREGVFKGIPMVHARHQKSALAERSGEAPGEAGREPDSDEACAPRYDTENTGSGLLHAALTRANLS